MNKSAVEEAMLPDEQRYSLIIESTDWDTKITPALMELGELLERGSLELYGFFKILRVICESIYVMGYNRAKKEKGLSFFVKEN